MTFTEKERSKALAIVNIFETSRPFGNYSACAVLDDGAGISYGINQFTHRSGSLAVVVEAYLKNGGRIGREKFVAALQLLKRPTALSIARLSRDEQLKKALRSAGVTREMKEAQREIAFVRYLRPAINLCEARGFSEPLSLAVICDSVTHGSFDKIVRLVSADTVGEKAWITEYVRRRHFWLTNIPRLRSTAYRTQFFLDQIAIGNWEMLLPVTVHGVRLTERSFPPAYGGEHSSISKPAAPTADTSAVKPTIAEQESAGMGWESVRGAYSSAAVGFDRVDELVSTVVTRKDSAKSLWTTVCGGLSQAAWAVFGFVAGIPRTVWLVVAVIAAALMFLYLYRQITLGKIRESGAAAGLSASTNSKSPTSPNS